MRSRRGKSRIYTDTPEKNRLVYNIILSNYLLFSRLETTNNKKGISYEIEQHSCYAGKYY
jgi:hypothetical protein